MGTKQTAAGTEFVVKRPLAEDGTRSVSPSVVCIRGETGASLILALVFLIVASLIVVSIAGLTATGLGLTTSYATAQSMTAAADVVTEAAIQQARYDFEQATLNNPVRCTSTQSPSNEPAVQAWCDTLWDYASPSTRTVIVSTCLNSISTGVACEVSPLLQAIVVFDDYPTAYSESSCLPVSPLNPVQNTTCGEQMSLNSWAFNVSPPVVTGVVTTPPGQNICTSSPIVVTGTGFAPNPTVEFVSASLFSNNVVFDATVVSATSTSINAVSPTLPANDSYYVVVVGSTGANAYGPTTNTPKVTCVN